LEFEALVKQWREKENLRQKTNAFLAALAVNAFGARANLQDLLPFPPQPRYLTIPEAERTIDRLAVRYGGTVH
jgi:hypothetical protein